MNLYILASDGMMQKKHVHDPNPCLVEAEPVANPPIMSPI